MGKTAISWSDETWNPTRGCSRVSEGCRNCYAEVMAARITRMGKGKLTAYDGLVKLVGGEPRWTGKVAFDAVKLAAPLRWRDPRRIFVNSMSDLFHESLTNEQIAAVFGVMAACPQHTFQVLTKRARRMREWFAWVERNADPRVAGCIFQCDSSAVDLLSDSDCKLLKHTASRWPLPNVWLGVSVENQAAADERIPDLLATPAAVRFLSCEPLLGPIDLKMQLDRADDIDWVIVGCESGPGARRCDVDWLRVIRLQCEDAGTALFLKQASDGIAEVTTGPGSRRKPGGVIELPYLDGIQHAAFPVIR